MNCVSCGTKFFRLTESYKSQNFSTLLVKDRVYNHEPLKVINDYKFKIEVL